MGGKQANRTKHHHHQRQKNRGRLSLKQQQQANSSGSRNQEEGGPQLKENLSFCGCGFLGIYHVGVASCFHEYAPQLSMHKIAGSSAGALVAVAHICGNLQLAYATTDIFRVAIAARAKTLGPLHPSFDINTLVRDALEKGLPDDVHLKVSGKLHISLTRNDDGENVVVSDFDSKEDVIQALICSCFIPYWSGLVPPKYKGVTYKDGGFSNNLLRLDDKTVTVSPFAGESDICPRDDVENLMTVSVCNTSLSMTPQNLYRFKLALLPPSPEVLKDLCEQGFADGVRFLQKMKLISCEKCLEFRSSLLVTSDETAEYVEQTTSTTTTSYSYQSHRRDSTSSYSIDTQSLNNESDEYLSYEDENCDGCLLRRESALRDPLPKQFADRIREACENVNKSLYNWFYSHRPIQYLSYLAAPYYLPMNLSLALVSKYWQQLPAFIGTELIKCIYDLKDLILEIARRLERSTTSMLMSPDDDLREACEEMKLKQSTSESSISVKITADCRRSSMRSLTTYECCLTVVLFGRQTLFSI